MLNTGDIGPHWCHLYGWPENAPQNIIDECEKKGETPTAYKGAVMLSASCFPDAGARMSKKSAIMPDQPA